MMLTLFLDVGYSKKVNTQVYRYLRQVFKKVGVCAFADHTYRFRELNIKDKIALHAGYPSPLIFESLSNWEKFGRIAPFDIDCSQKAQRSIRDRGKDSKEADNWVK